MGNCISNNENYICYKCNKSFDTQYIKCNQCNKKYHTYCIEKGELYKDVCNYCKSTDLKYLELSRLSIKNNL